jgi:phosphoribosylglycinamide formyltransferase-1
MQVLIDAVRGGQLEATIRVVISNEPDAAGLVRAREAGVETLVMPHRGVGSRDDFDRALAAALTSRGVTFVCLAGFMRRLGPAFCAIYPDAILNIHPSLLPAFPGLDAQRQALEYGVRVSGATVHFVTTELDAGPIVMQEAVPVFDDDTVGALADRILAVEHRIYPVAVGRILRGGWRIEGRRVRFDAHR